MLPNLARERDGLWLCCGNFNEILNVSKKTGSIIRSQKRIDNFRHVVEDCGLYEFAFTRYEFTWDNKRDGEVNVKERIDLGFGNLDLIQ